ncbi:probable inactive receptor kinase At1g48480 [Typha angustifolia]|uniref:probable inactive receptor kinase At1g48480 n=1 Tax=Typha angustifolia TaxID=59011 RepID=UPI003C2BEE7A
MESPPLTFLVLFLLSLIGGAAPDLASDHAALLAFRDAVGPAVRWNTSSPPCSWPGVECFGGRVTELHLPSYTLAGEIPAGTLGNLTALRTLSLRINSLSGPLPADIAALAQLRSLYLQDNLLSGEIPPAIFSLPLLVRLNLARNRFSGGISPEFAKLTRLRTLYLENNRLTGEIPGLNFISLDFFNVSFNQLNGSVPASLRSMPASAFLGMPLCGGPLGPCPDEISPAPGLPLSSRKKLSDSAVAGIAIGSALGLLILLVLFLLCRRKFDGPKKSPVEAEIALSDKESSKVSGKTKPPPSAAPGGGKNLVFMARVSKVYDLEDLLKASAEVLGKGTFGTTYKAVLEMGAVVAVKRLKDVNLPDKEFIEKISAIGAMAHPNIVPLQAYYCNKDEKLLVFEFMSMGSLSSLLHGSTGSGHTALDWESRSSIALAAARGIAYIHSTNPKASHGNISSSNVLLSRSYEARISDHGLAHLSGAAVISLRSAGYRAPEVTDARNVSQKADVFSFGVLLLELLTGKAPAHTVGNDEGVDLPRWVRSVVREEWTAEVFDVELLGNQSVEQEMVQLLQLALDCAASHPERRPTMAEVVVRIEEISTSTSVSPEAAPNSRVV